MQRILLIIVMMGTLVGINHCSFNPTTFDERDVPDGMVRYYSSLSSGHQHTVYILEEEIENPPSQRIYYTNIIGGHDHTLILTEFDYLQLQQGYQITLYTNAVNGHDHYFDIRYSSGN